MKLIYNILGLVLILLTLNFLATWIFVSKNNGKDFVEKYIKSSKEVKIKVKKESFDDMFDGYSYLKQIIIFKGIFGNSSNYTFRDGYSGKFYKIVRFDKYGNKFSHPQTYLIDNKELNLKVDPLQINNPSFGTKENPILVFSYKGVNDDFIMDMDTDEKDESGVYKQAPISIAPTEEEYRYNVEQYLTYVMPKEEFKKRFK